MNALSEAVSVAANFPAACATHPAPRPRHRLRTLALAVLSSVVWTGLYLGAAPAQAQPARSGDDFFLMARDAARVGNRPQLERISHLLQTQHPDYLLSSYVEYWRLRAKLEDAPLEGVRDFLDRNAGSFLAERLRSDWLKVLGRNELWDEFRRERPKLVNEDPEVACFGLLARYRNRDESALDELKITWLTPRELPEGCVPLAEAAFAAGRYGQRDVWARVRALAEANMNGGAKRALSYLPRTEAPDAKQFDRALGESASYLAHLSKAPLSKTQIGKAQKELVVLALARVARNEPQVALTLFDTKLRAQLPQDDQAYVWGQIATSAARRHLPESLGGFREARDAPSAAPLTDEQLAWWTRIALREQAWGDVRDAVDRMSAQGRSDPTWIYWRGRAMKALGRAEEAKALFSSIAAEYNFYGRLAAEELGLVIQLPPKAAPLTEGEIASAADAPGVKRALALFRLNMRTEGVREWNWNIRTLDDRKLIAASEVARRAEIWDRAINTADRTVAVHDFSLRYLAPYRQIFTENAKMRELEESWVLGLVRQESRFITNAKSTAGAAGLMQLMPATAQWVARKMGMKDFSLARVHDVDVNTALGTFYLRTVLNELDGHPVLAAAAYNAGPGRARRWRDAKPIEGAIYAESIPFNETRDYVKKVMSNTMYYSAVLGGQTASLKERLGMVAPRRGGAEAAPGPDPAP